MALSRHFTLSLEGPRCPPLRNSLTKAHPSNPFLLMPFRTLWRNGALTTPLPSIGSALFSIQRGVGGSRSSSQTRSSLPYLLPKRLSDEDSRPERARRVEGSL